MIAETIDNIKNGKTLSQDEMVAAMSGIMNGEWTTEQMSAFLLGLSARGETIDEITGAARVMRDKALPIDAPSDAVDCCGTGGDASGTYNISTAVAIVAAACSVPIAKHGNRSASSKSGAADVLEALGVNLDVPRDRLEHAIREFNFAFLMAPNHHSAMKHVIPVRKSLGVRTIFNVLGPLANPASTQFQLIGVFDRALVVTMAEALRNLGTKKAWVVHGTDGLDEITTTGETFVAKLEDGQITECVLSPTDFGLDVCDPKDLIGGAPEENASALREILGGTKNAYFDIVCANTAAVLNIADKTDSLEQGAKMAADVMSNGAALQLLENYIEYTHQNAEKV